MQAGARWGRRLAAWGLAVALGLPGAAVAQWPSAQLPPPVPAQAPAPPEPVHVWNLPAPDKAPVLESGSVYFVGTATVILRYAGFTILTDPNFLHKGDHAHLGYGLKSPRLTDPAMKFEQLPPVDLVLLSHYHGDHFDQIVEEKLPRDTRIVTTDHAARQLRERGFTAVQALDTWQSVELRRGDARLRISAMPGRHGPTGARLALPDVMGSLLEFHDRAGRQLWRMYISGDTLAIDELREIPRRHPGIDLALLHLGGTRVFGVLVTMDAEQGVQALRMIDPATAIPIHYNDYAVFMSPLEDFRKAVRAAGLEQKVKYLSHGDTHEFRVPRQRLP